MKVHHRAGTRLQERPQIPSADPVPVSFETTESQELTWDVHILSKHREGRVGQGTS